MRLILAFIMLWMLAAGAPAAKGADTNSPHGNSGTLETEVLAEINLARTAPAQYASHLESYRKLFKDGKNLELKPGLLLATVEGPSAVDEAIGFLKKAAAVGPLVISHGLSLAAADHVKDIGPKGTLSHEGTDNSKPWDRMGRYGKWDKINGENISFGMSEARAIVMQFIIDDGVQDRGHRKNLYRPEFHMVGTATGPHKVHRIMCVLDFAGQFTEKRQPASH